MQIYEKRRNIPAFFMIFNSPAYISSGIFTLRYFKKVGYSIPN